MSTPAAATNALYTYISSQKKSKKIIEFRTGDSHMVTTHCSIDQAMRCLFTAERMGCETFIILSLNKIICPSEYLPTSSTAVPTPTIAAANTAIRSATSQYSSCQSCICREWRVPGKHSICRRSGDYGSGDGFGDCGVGGAGSGDIVEEGTFSARLPHALSTICVFDSKFKK